MRTRTTEPGQRTLADLIGPINPTTLLGNGKYILTLVDDYSRYATTYVLKNKKETKDRLKTYFTYLQTIVTAPGKIAKLRNDAGTE